MGDLARLVQDLQQSPMLQAKLAGVDSLESAVTAAQDAGYTITAEEVSAYMAAAQGAARQELSDEQLDAVAGGKGSFFDQTRGSISGTYVRPIMG